MVSTGRHGNAFSTTGGNFGLGTSSVGLLTAVLALEPDALENVRFEREPSCGNRRGVRSSYWSLHIVKGAGIASMESRCVPSL